MRYRRYFRQDGEGVVQQIDFTVNNYREAGTLITPEYGMHPATALALINRWNKENPDFKFWL